MYDDLLIKDPICDSNDSVYCPVCASNGQTYYGGKCSIPYDFYCLGPEWVHDGPCGEKLKTILIEKYHGPFAIMMANGNIIK